MLDPTQYQDWQIAQEAEKGLPPVSYFQEQLGLLPQEIIPYGNTPKLDFMKIMARLSGKPDGKYIEVTAITPTPSGGREIHHLFGPDRGPWQAGQAGGRLPAAALRRAHHER